MSTGTAQRVGFVGLGDQGAPIAQRIASNGFPLGVWARRPESLGPFAGTAAFIAPTLQELGAWSDVVGVCVVNDDDVREVVLAPGALLDGMHGGSCLIIHSTVAPATCDELGERAAARGVAMLDAPVSGGAAGASAGTLAVMVGGPAPVLDRVRPVLESFAGLLAHLGPLGAGQRAKIVNNLLFTAILSLSAEAITAGGAMGLSEPALLEVLAAGSSSSFALRASQPGGGPGSILRRARETHLQKDVALARSLIVASPVGEEPLILRVAEKGISAARAPADPPAPPAG
ncbi:MAG TPA: NAD(P)-dependent oxidoreductase [Acidimicrobiales bacterium]|nr:NAD(P)-dependent oxidoreductase [Acidimicrobiales bacterium]